MLQGGVCVDWKRSEQDKMRHGGVRRLEDPVFESLE